MFVVSIILIKTIIIIIFINYWGFLTFSCIQSAMHSELLFNLIFVIQEDHDAKMTM